MLQQLVIRCGFACVGGFGVMSSIPNAMLSETGAANIGLCASGSFCLAGITGILHNRLIPLPIPIALYHIGMVLQISAFVVPWGNCLYQGIF